MNEEKKSWEKLWDKRPYYSTFSGWVRDVIKKQQLEPWLEEAKSLFEDYEKVIELNEKGYLEESFNAEFYKHKIEQIKQFCDENTKAIEYQGGIQYVVPVYLITEVLDK